MGLSRLSEKCRTCPFASKCDHKRMEALTYLSEPQMAVNAAQPLLRENEIEKKLYDHLYSRLGMRYGTW